MRRHGVAIILAVAGWAALTKACSADVVMDWHEIAVAQVVAARQLPPEQSRTMAIVHVAMFDAVNAVEQRYRPYLAKSRPQPGASADAAAAVAAYAILLKIFPDAKGALDDYRARSKAGREEAFGSALGRAVADEIIAARATDGSGAPNLYRPVVAKGVYAPTSLPVSFDSATMKPWILGRPDQLRPARPPILSGPQWAQDYNEVKDTGGRVSTTRTPEQTDVGRFWAATGVATWAPIVRQLAAGTNLSLIEKARLFAMVEVAAADAYIAVFDAKYHYNFWRPVTAIRNGDSDDNDATARDAAWLPLIDTPMHPEYPCAHCITASAVATVLEARFGAGEVRAISMTSPTAPGVTRTWRRIADYVEEVSNARVWGGVHYRTSATVAKQMGADIGRMVIERFAPPLK
jgi:hypothetical protein